MNETLCSKYHCRRGIGHSKRLFLYPRTVPTKRRRLALGLYQAIDSLEKLPERCSTIREQEAFEDEARELLYHSHRIIFTIQEHGSLVLVHAFRHTAQDNLMPPHE